MKSSAYDRKLVELAAEVARRKKEAIKLYRPLPAQRVFHESRAWERIVRGGNRAGKSLCAAVEVAAAAVGEDLAGIELPYPKDRPLIIWLVGWGEKHIGQTFYRLLFEPGAFKIIKDPRTGQWRAFQPGDDESQAKPAPPLIPRRACNPEVDIAWEDKGLRHFGCAHVRTTGTKIFSFTSTGEVKQGDPVDLIWIDEDVRYPEYLQEWEARLSDARGRLIWTAFPHARNDALLRLSERAKVDSSHVAEFVLTFTGNPYIDDEQKRIRLAGWTPEEIAARDRGEFVFDSSLIYPQFDEELHCLKLDGRPTETQLESVVRLCGKAAPEHWSHYIGVDPGHAVQAAVFLSVPPPDEFNVWLVWNEVRVVGQDARVFAREVKRQLGGRRLAGAVIDYRAGRQTPLGRSDTTVQFYTRAFHEEGVLSESQYFQYGSDNVSGRIMRVRELLTPNERGVIRLRFVKERLPNLLMSFASYRARVLADDATVKPVVGDDMMHALEYVCSVNPQYMFRVPPKRVAILDVFRNWQMAGGKARSGIWCGVSFD